MIDLRYYWNSLVCSKLYIQHQRLTPNIDTILQVTNSLVPEQYSAGARCFTIMCGRMRHLHCFGNILQILSLKMVGALSSVVRERPHTTISGTAHAWHSTSLWNHYYSTQWATWSTRRRYSLYSTWIFPLPSDNWWSQYRDKHPQRHFSNIGEPKAPYAKVGLGYRYMLERYQKLENLYSSGFYHSGQPWPRARAKLEENVFFWYKLWCWSPATKAVAL